jgi:biopolymer transport protein ExbD
MSDDLFGADAEKISFSSIQSGEDDDMDMTPMVDVTFLLLIFFIMTATFSLQKSLQVPTPQPEEASTQAIPQETEEDPEFLTVEVDETNTFFVYMPDGGDPEEASSIAELYIKLRQARDDATKSFSKLVVRAHEDCWHESVVAALDAGMLIGMDEVQLMTITGDE